MAEQPWPDVGGRITSVHTLEEWQALCAKKGPMIVDFYATWCPPCKAAAPIYARMSEEEAFAKCTFAKVNVDEVRAVASSENVSAMPTFGFFEDGKRSTQVVGFSEAKIRQMLNSKLKLNTVNDNPPKELQKVTDHAARFRRASRKKSCLPPFYPGGHSPVAACAHLRTVCQSP